MLYDTKRWDKDVGLPQFGPRRHSFSRLDIRPVLWSLRNRPEEWEQTTYTLLHKPSKHEFWPANGFFFYELYGAGGCSCQRVRHGGFSLIQKFQFAVASAQWRRCQRHAAKANLEATNAQFAKHFIGES